MAFNKLLVEYLSLLSCSGKKGIRFHKSVVNITLEYNDSLSCFIYIFGVKVCVSGGVWVHVLSVKFWELAQVLSYRQSCQNLQELLSANKSN